MKPTTRGIYFENSAAKYEGSIIPTVSAGTDIKVIKYNNKNDIEIEFLDTGYSASINLNSLRHGSVYNPFLRNSFGGYFGVGPYTKNNHKKIYAAWRNMCCRVLEMNQNNHRNRNYAGVSVC